MKSPITFCISTYNNLNYLKIAISSVRANSFYKEAPFIIYAENCEDGTDEWLKDNANLYDLDYFVEKNKVAKGIGGGLNFLAEKVKTEYIMFLHSDFYVTKDWDLELLKVLQDSPKERMWVSSYRIEPDMFEGSQSRPGTLIIPKDIFGAYYYDFNQEEFEEWAKEFKELNDVRIPKGEGVSGLIRKVDWDSVGGNDPIFAPASYEDMDLFLRMRNQGFKFALTSRSLVWHFGARGSHRLEENNGKSDLRQVESERKNVSKFVAKWGGLPIFDEFGMIKGVN